VKKITTTSTNLYLVDTRNPSGYAQVLEEFTVTSGATNLAKAYTYGLNLISQRALGSSTVFFTYDGHGSTRMLTDAGGNFINAFAYDAYGNLIASNSTPQTVYLYAGQQWDPDLSQYYNRARTWQPNTGRFWTMDSYAGNNEDPLSLHKYLYGGDDPVNNIDPSGEDFEALDVMDISGTLDGIGLPMASMAQNRALRLGGIDVDVYIWKWKGLGVVGPGQHSVGHVMVIDDGTQNVEVSQFPHGVGEPSTPKGPNHRLNYNDTFTEENERNPDTKFLVHLPNPPAFHAAVQNEVSRSWWVWDPHGPNQTQCARAGYDVLKAGGLPLWGYGDQGEIMPGWLSVKLNQFANFNNPNNNYSVGRIQ
jgi:RHS repeat-associated protein